MCLAASWLEITDVHTLCLYIRSVFLTKSTHRGRLTLHTKKGGKMTRLWKMHCLQPIHPQRTQLRRLSRCAVLLRPCPRQTLPGASSCRLRRPQRLRLRVRWRQDRWSLPTGIGNREMRMQPSTLLINKWQLKCVRTQPLLLNCDTMVQPRAPLPPYTRTLFAMRLNSIFIRKRIRIIKLLTKFRGVDSCSSRAHTLSCHNKITNCHTAIQT